MPELPEVHTITEQLRRNIIGKKIVAAEQNDIRIIDSKIKNVINTTITAVDRRGKALVISLEERKFLFIRLGMTGHFYYYYPDEQKKNERYQVARFSFQDSSSLQFHDTRRFGSLKVLNEKELEKKLQQFGPEPLEKEFTLQKFTRILDQKKNSVIKTTLMDQHFIAGIGNIYAQEALYRAKIDPRRKITSLSSREIAVLHQEIKKTLRSAIYHNGTSFLSFLHLDGSGEFQKFLTVYQKEKCPKKHQLKKIYLGSRGTFYCPKCQR